MGFRAVGECGWEECVSGMVDTLVAGYWQVYVYVLVDWWVDGG